MGKVHITQVSVQVSVTDNNKKTFDNNERTNIKSFSAIV